VSRHFTWMPLQRRFIGGAEAVPKRSGGGEMGFRD